MDLISPVFSVVHFINNIYFILYKTFLYWTSKKWNHPTIKIRNLNLIFRSLYLKIKLKIAITALNCSDDLASWGYHTARTIISKMTLRQSMTRARITKINTIIWNFSFKINYINLLGLVFPWLWIPHNMHNRKNESWSNNLFPLQNPNIDHDDNT